MKKIKSTILGFIMCVMILCSFNMKVYAAEGKISFSDPQTTVGEEFTINVKAEISDSVKIGEVWIKLTYDTNFLEFVSADSGKNEGGAIVITQPIENPTADYCTYTVKFKALQSGNTTVDVSSYNISDANGKSVNVSKIGKSAIKIGEGTLAINDEEVSDMISEAEEELATEIDENDYLLSSNGNEYMILEFPDSLTMSSEYTLTELEIGDNVVSAYQNNNVANYYLLYLKNQVDSEGLYLYCIDDNSFVKYDENVLSAEDVETSEKLVAVTENYNDLLKNYNTNMKTAKDMMYIGIVIIVVLLIIVINLIFRGGKSKEDDFDEDEFEDEEEIEEIEEQNEEDYDEDFEYEKELTRSKRKEKRKKKAKKESENDYDEDFNDKEDEFELEFFDFDDED